MKIVSLPPAGQRHTCDMEHNLSLMKMYHIFYSVVSHSNSTNTQLADKNKMVGTKAERQKKNLVVPALAHWPQIGQLYRHYTVGKGIKGSRGSCSSGSISMEAQLK